MIDSNRVSKVFSSCLFKEEEVIDGVPVIEPIKVEGITNNYGLHPERVKKSEDEINSFISELPETFKSGWSFLNLCQTKDGDQWTGLHSVCEQLVILGIAIGKMKYCAPKELWVILPGGVPYIQTI